MAFHTEKDLKSKNFIVFTLAKDVNTERKFEIKAKKVLKASKGLYVWVTLLQAVVTKTINLFYKIFSGYKKLGP